MGYSDGFVGYGIETTPGVPVTPTLFLPYKEESMTTGWEHLASEARIAGMLGQPSELYDVGSAEVAGDTSHEIHYSNMGTLFQAMLGDISSGTVTPAGTLPSLTVQVGRPDKNGTIVPTTYTGCKVASGVVEFGTGEFSDITLSWTGMRSFGLRTVTDGVTTSSSGTITSATANFNPSDIGSPISGTGISASTTISSVLAGTQAVMSGTATASGTAITFTIGVAAASPSTTPVRAYKFVDGGVTLDNSSGTPTSTCVRSGQIEVDNGLDTDRPCAGTPWRAVAAETGSRMVTGSLEVEFEGRGERDRFLNQQVMSLAVNHTARGAALAMSSEIVWTEVPDPSIPSDTVLTHELGFAAVQESTSDDLLTVIITEP